MRVNSRGIAVGEFVEITPPERIVWTWGWEGNDEVPPGSSTVEVTLTADGDATIVRLRHSGLPDDGWRAKHDDGWGHYIGAAGGGRRGRRPRPRPAGVTRRERSRDDDGRPARRRRRSRRRR